jgi:DNA replication and repair protein RecF
LVSHVRLHDFRSYGRQELELAQGLVLVVGPNGAGKTNLLEGIHLGSQGFSFRTRRDAGVVRFGTDTARVELRGLVREATPFATQITVGRGGAKQIELDGAAVQSHEELRRRLSVLVFTPDRLAVVKGSPAIRRRYLDRMISRLSPSKASLSAEYGAALTQRNAALRRVRAGLLERDAVGPWTDAVARLGDDLERARGETVAVIAPRFSEEAAVLGLATADLRYPASEVTVDALEERLERDVERGTTGIGPHLQDVELAAAGTELRTYGSQGQQRVAMLALLLAELRALSSERAETPLLLLDDVLSELDDGRRRALLNSVPAGCQVLVTSTTERAVPADAPAPAQVIEVAAGTARQR